MTKEEFDKQSLTLSVSHRQQCLKLDKEMDCIAQERMELSKQQAEIANKDKKLKQHFEIILRKKQELKAFFAQQRLELMQQYSETEQVNPSTNQLLDKETMHNVRRCVLGCLKHALEDKCDTDDIQFNFHFSEDGSLKLDCVIPDIHL